VPGNYGFNVWGGIDSYDVEKGYMRMQKLEYDAKLHLYTGQDVWKLDVTFYTREIVKKRGLVHHDIGESSTTHHTSKYHKYWC
jgi:hypothetical protein